MVLEQFQQYCGSWLFTTSNIQLSPPPPRHLVPALPRGDALTLGAPAPGRHKTSLPICTSPALHVPPSTHLPEPLPNLPPGVPARSEPIGARVEAARALRPVDVVGDIARPCLSDQVRARRREEGWASMPGRGVWFCPSRVLPAPQPATICRKSPLVAPKSVSFSQIGGGCFHNVSADEIDVNNNMTAGGWDTSIALVLDGATASIDLTTLVLDMRLANGSEGRGRISINLRSL